MLGLCGLPAGHPVPILVGLAHARCRLRSRLQAASIVCVTTLYIRDVSDEVAETLKDRAAEAGMSLSAYVAGELAKIAARPTNAEIVTRLKSRNRAAGPSTTEIVEAVRASRR